jgi:uncharacterized membrane protein
MIERLNTFADAVLAIVATIMVLELKLPEKGAHTFHDILPLTESIAIFAVSFILVLGFYFGNAKIFNNIEKISSRGVAYFFMWMLVISLLPFFVRWLFEDNNNRWAILGYGIVVLLTNFINQVLVNDVVVTNYSEKNETKKEDIILAKVYQFVLGFQAKLSFWISVIALIIAFFFPTWGLWLFIIIPIFNFFRNIFDSDTYLDAENSEMFKKEMETKDQTRLNNLVDKFNEEKNANNN